MLRLWLAVIYSFVLVTFCAAQNVEKNTQIEAPRTDASQDYIELASQYRIKTELQYLGNKTEREIANEPQNTRDFSFSGKGFNVYFVILFFVVAIFIFLKFGGNGSLMHASPATAKNKKTVAPSSWKLEHNVEDLDKHNWLAKLAKSKNYRAALIEMLRYSLLEGGRATNTIYLRSDTERDAFARLPKAWDKKDDLGELLKVTELAHYGGRDVSSDGFAEALKICRNIFGLQSVRQ